MNVSSYLPRRAEETPNAIAIYFPSHNRQYKTITFQELESLSNSYASQFQKLGIQKGHRMILMVKPSIEFIGITFALLKMGAASVLIDPGIGREFLVKCIGDVKPHGFIGIPKAHVLRLIAPHAFKTSLFNIVVGPKWFFWMPILRQKMPGTFPLVETKDHDQASIIFTTGSTGPPKGVVYEHGMFHSQIKLLQSHYKIEPGEIDMPTFPLFALFSTAMGTSCVIPDMDPTKPARVDPEKIVFPILDKKVTYTFGSPALWNRVTHYCIQKNIKLPSIKRILIAGAPVPIAILERFQKILSPQAEVYTPYGATEALPVTSIGSHEMVKGSGTCVGKAFPNTEVKIIKLSDEPIREWSEKLIVPVNTIGEIAVKGAHVTREYFENEKENLASKIQDSHGGFWHRMGDVGYLDDKGRLWFCGRKAHRVITPLRTLFTDPIESIFNNHRQVFRSALVGINREPIIIIEPRDKGILKNTYEKENLKKELLLLAQKNALTQEIKNILFHPSFPVDIRHNSKIIREKLALWARESLK